MTTTEQIKDEIAKKFMSHLMYIMTYERTDAAKEWEALLEKNNVLKRYAKDWNTLDSLIKDYVDPQKSVKSS